MTRRRALTSEESEGLKRHLQQIERNAAQPVGFMTCSSPCDSYLVWGYAELAFENKRQAAQAAALVALQHPHEPVTPELRAARQALVAELAERAGMKKSVPQIARGHGKAVGWTDRTLVERIRAFRRKLK
jgi:hypothetical protein